MSLDNRISKVFPQAFKASLPALTGYVSLGISFGLIFQKAGGAWFLAPLMSLLVYAGAAQFVAISLLLSHGSLFQIAEATFVINIRHIFYGISFLGKFPYKALKKIYMIFGITDETYSILTAIKEPTPRNFDFFVIVLSHFYWVLGTLIGVLLGAILPFDLGFLKFSLTALFVVLTIEQACVIGKVYPFIIGILAIVIASIFFQELLISAIMLSILFLVINYKMRVVTI